MTTADIRRAEVPPREDLMRMAPFALRADDEVEGDGNTLDGYAAVFNRETIIDSWEGRFKEKLSPGSMKRSFRELRPKIQFDHGRHPLIGSIPIAQPADGYPREDLHPTLAPEGGAHIVAPLHDNWLIQPVRDAIVSRSVDGMSFRFSIVRENWYDVNGKQIRDEEKLREALRRTWFEDVPDDELLLRDLKEVKVPELGPVVFPAYQDTSVGVRSNTVVIDLGRLDDPEQRKTLARAVIMADAAEQKTPDEPQRIAEDNSADEHRESDDDAQQTTRSDDPVGEHPSPTPESRKRRDRIRAATRHFSAYVADLPDEESGDA